MMKALLRTVVSRPPTASAKPQSRNVTLLTTPATPFTHSAAAPPTSPPPMMVEFLANRLPSETIQKGWPEPSMTVPSSNLRVEPVIAVMFESEAFMPRNTMFDEVMFRTPGPVTMNQPRIVRLLFTISEKTVVSKEMFELPSPSMAMGQSMNEESSMVS